MSIWRTTTALNKEMYQSRLSRDQCLSALLHLTIVTQYQFCMTVERDMSPDEIERQVLVLFSELACHNLNHHLLENILDVMPFSRDTKLKTRFLQIGDKLLQKYQ